MKHISNMKNDRRNIFSWHVIWNNQHSLVMSSSCIPKPTQESFTFTRDFKTVTSFVSKAFKSPG